MRPHKHFVRHNDDIQIEVPVSSVDATLGCEVDVPTVYGDVTMKIPAGTQSGAVMRFKGKGVKHLRGDGYGDQYVKINVQIPKKLTRKEKELYEQLRKVGKSGSIFDSFKNAFKN